MSSITLDQYLPHCLMLHVKKKSLPRTILDRVDSPLLDVFISTLALQQENKVLIPHFSGSLSERILLFDRVDKIPLVFPT